MKTFYNEKTQEIEFKDQSYKERLNNAEKELEQIYNSDEEYYKGSEQRFYAKLSVAKSHNIDEDDL